MSLIVKMQRLSNECYRHRKYQETACLDALVKWLKANDINRVLDFVDLLSMSNDNPNIKPLTELCGMML